METTSDMALVFRSNWGILTVALVVLGIGLVGYLWNRPTRHAVSRRAYMVLSVLHIIAGLLLALWFVNPRIRYRERSSDSGGLAVVIDTSASMSVVDPRSDASRHRRARDLLLSSSSDIHSSLEETGQLLYYTFDRTLRAHPNERKAGEVKVEGRSTGLATTLKALAAEARIKRMHGIVVATDGRASNRAEVRGAAQSLAVPVYTVGFGAPEDPDNPWKNVGIVRIDAPTRLAEEQEAEVVVTLEQSGSAGSPLRISLEEDEEVHDSEYLTLTGAPRQTIRLQCTPKKRGTRTLAVKISATAGDSLEADDEQMFSVLVDDRTLKVLYVEGRLRWNYKFLRRILESETTIDADCLVRTGGAKLYQQGDEELQLRGVLPPNLDALAEYDVVLLGDIPRSLLPDNQIRMLQRYVQDRQGGLFFIAGPEMLGGTAYQGSPLDNLLPAPLPDIGKTDSAGPIYQLRLTQMGRTAPALTGLRGALEKIKIRNFYSLGKQGAGTQVLLEAQAEGDNKPVPMLMAHRLGEGRILLLTTEDLWQPVLYETGSRRNSPMARFWLQSIQWLAHQDQKVSKDAPLLMAMTDRSYYEPGDLANITVFLREPGADLQADVLVEPIDKNGLPVGEWTKTESLAFPASDDSGQTQTAWTPTEPGNYALALKAETRRDSQEVYCRFSVGRPYGEMARTTLDEDLLRRIANETGGGYYTPLTLADLPQSIERNPMIQSRLVEKDVLDSPLLLAAFILIVSTGWTIRRRRNLI